MTSINVYPDLTCIVDENNPDSTGTPDAVDSGDERIYSSAKRALLHFSVPDAYKYRRISAATFYGYFWPTGHSIGSYVSFDGYVYPLLAPFSSSVTFNTADISQEYKFIAGGDSSGAAAYGNVSLKINSSAVFSVANIIRNGLAFKPGINQNSGGFSTRNEDPRNYLKVYISDSDEFGYVRGSPSGGYVPKNEEATFRWSYASPQTIAANLTATSWRLAYKKGSTGSFTFIDVGTDLSYTFPAGTFSDTDSVYWYPEATLNDGQVLTPVENGNLKTYLLSTVEPAFSSVALSPDGTFEDGSEPITFRWQASNSAGTQPSGAELQYSADSGTTWTALGSVSGSGKSFVEPANSLPSGELQWRVRSLNSSNTAGAWSAALSFINVAAPPAPSVNTDAAPFTTITWDSLGQQAYEVFVDGVSFGVKFGTDRSFTLPQPLADGNHTAGVRIQGAYGLWSQIGESGFTVENAPSGTLELAGVFDTDALLSWNIGSAPDYLVYRDGVQIGHTTQAPFVDRRAVGTHEWHVLLRLADGNYTKSNVLTGTLTIESPMIAPLEGGPWISLRLTDSSLTQQTFRYSKTHTLRHFSGSAFPVLELSPYENLVTTFRCAFANDAEAGPFEALQGRVVIFKTKESVLVGGLLDVTKMRNPLYVAFQFTIEQIAVEEIVNDSDS